MKGQPMPKYQQYSASQYSAMMNEAAHDAWLKATQEERDRLQVQIDRIQAYQRNTGDNRGHQVNTIASGGIELLAKLAMFLNGVNYAEFITDAMKLKGQSK